MFGHKMRYEIKVSIGEVSLKLRQTNWTVAINNVNVVVRAMQRTQFSAKRAKNDLKPTYFLKHNFYFEMEGV